MKRRMIMLLTGLMVFSLLGICGAAAESGTDNLNEQPGDFYVAYIGGSITEGSGGSQMTYEDGTVASARWTTQLTKRYFEKKFPNKNVVEVNAGVGGTTSDLGLFRLEKDVIQKCGKQGPDVVFIEFSVNDMYTCISNPVESQKTVEGIVRQLARLPKQPVVILVSAASYRLREGEPEGFDKYLESAQVHREIAEYYGLGYINLCEYVAGGVDLNGEEIVWRPNEEGAWTLENCWTGDGTHPNNRGYTGYTDYIIHRFETDYDAYFKPIEWKDIPMSGYEFGHPKALSHRTSRASYTGDWKRIPAGEGALKSRFSDGAAVTDQAGATVSLEFEGRSIGLYASRSSIGAKASYVIDQGSANPITGTFSNYYPSGAMGVATLLRVDLTPGTHTITITTLPPEEDAKERTEFMFGYFFVDQEQPSPVIARAETDRIGKVGSGEPVKACYSYVNGAKEEGASVIQWYSRTGTDGEWTALPDAREKTFTPGQELEGSWIKYTVQPVNRLGTAGETVSSYPLLVSDQPNNLEVSYETGYREGEGKRNGVLRLKAAGAEGFVLVDRNGQTEQLAADQEGCAELSDLRPRFGAGRYVMAYRTEEGKTVWSAPVFALIDWDQMIE